MYPFKVGDKFVWLDKGINHMDYPERIGQTGTIIKVWRLNTPDVWDGEPVDYAVDIKNDDGDHEWGLYSIRFGLIQWEL